MADAAGDVLRLEAWVAPLLQRLEPPARRHLARTIGIDLRRRQQRRVARQENPDGTPYIARRAKPQRKGAKRGRIKRRAMFQRVRMARYMRLRTSAQEAAVGFTGRVARIARVHQEGRRDRVGRKGPVVRYAQRRLLGASPQDVQHITQQLIQHLLGTK